jgi:hypothetical protein
LLKLDCSESVQTHQDSAGGASARIVSMEVPLVDQSQEFASRLISRAPLTFKPLNYVEGFVLGENDVICSRDKDAQTHIGNKRYENLVRERVAEYHQNLPEDKSKDNDEMRKRRQDIKDGIIAAVRGAGGRFVRQTEDGRWYIVQERLADGVNEKVRRALSSRKKFASLLQGQHQGKSAEGSDFEDQSGGDTAVFDKDFSDLLKLLQDLQKDPSLADEKSSQKTVKEIADPDRLDVLLGRGGGAFNHHGNKVRHSCAHPMHVCMILIRIAHLFCFTAYATFGGISSTDLCRPGEKRETPARGEHCQCNTFVWRPIS